MSRAQSRNFAGRVKPVARWCGVAAALALVVSAAGCRVKRVPPPQPVKILGVSYIPEPPKGEKRGPAAATARTITASGDAAVPAPALDPLQGRLVAAQMAKQAARRELAHQLEAVEVEPGRTVADLIRQDAGKRRMLEDLVRDTQPKGVVKSEGGKCTVILSVELRQLEAVLGLKSAPAMDAAESSPTTPREELQQRAQREALEDARRRALEFVQSIPLRGRGGETIGDRMQRDAEVDRGIREKLEGLSPDSVNFRGSGACQVALVLDLTEIQAIANRKAASTKPPRSGKRPE